MRVVALAGTKGGVGKTTLALNLAYALARRGRGTLLVDADPQGAVGLSLTGRARDAPGLAQIVAGTLAPADVVLPTRVAELSILPSGRFPVAALDDFVGPLASAHALGAVFQQLAPHYDVVLVDCPSGLGGITRGVLASASHLLCPLQTEPLALRLTPRLLELVAALRAAGSALTIAGFVLTMVQSRDHVSSASAQEAWRLLPGNLVLEGFVPRDAAFLQASARGVPVALLERRPPPVAAVFDGLAAEVEPRIGLTGGSDEGEPLSLLD